MQWEVRRGVLNPPTAAAPGSPWWRALNDRLLHDGCEAAARGSGSTWSCCGCCTRTRWSPRRGWLAPLGRLLGDPRLGMAGIFLSLRRVVPNRYPLADEVEGYVGEENGFGRTLDYRVIRPRLQRLYEWSAAELGEPRAATLINAGTPSYAWPAAEWQVWKTPPP